MLMHQKPKLQLPSRVSEAELMPPDDQDPEAWLSALDIRPTLFPSWPESTQVTLVAVVGGAGPDEVSRAFVITRKTTVDELLDSSGWHRNFPVLFFRVLKIRVIPLVPGFTLEAWLDA